jgi:hypothetical protein
MMELLLAAHNGALSTQRATKEAVPLGRHFAGRHFTDLA